MSKQDLIRQLREVAWDILEDLPVSASPKRVSEILTQLQTIIEEVNE